MSQDFFKTPGFSKFHNRIPYIYNLLVNLKLKLSVIKQIKIYILSIQITPIASVDTSIIQMFICFTFKWLVHKCLASVKKIYERRSAEQCVHFYMFQQTVKVDCKVAGKNVATFFTLLHESSTTKNISDSQFISTHTNQLLLIQKQVNKFKDFRTFNNPF